jgi:hypothetical protein
MGQFFKWLLPVGTLRRGSLTVFIVSVLRSYGIELDRATSYRKMRTLPSTRTFANGPAAIVRVENVARSDGQLQRTGLAVTEDAPWALQSVAEPFREQIMIISDAGAASGVPYSALDKRANTRATSGCEIEMYTPAMFTAILKKAGVEQDRVTAKVRPGAPRA